MKKYILMFCLFVATMVNAQSFPDGKIDAFTKQNPASPVRLTYCSVTPIDSDFVLISYIVQGHGSYSCFEVVDNGASVLLFSGKATQQPIVCFLLVPADHFVGCFFNLFNVHGWGGPEI